LSLIYQEFINPRSVAPPILKDPFILLQV